jgi:hypothetical protein
VKRLALVLLVSLSLGGCGAFNQASDLNGRWLADDGQVWVFQNPWCYWDNYGSFETVGEYSAVLGTLNIDSGAYMGAYTLTSKSLRIKWGSAMSGSMTRL